MKACPECGEKMTRVEGSNRLECWKCLHNEPALAKNREEWLNKMAKAMEPKFESLEYPLPPYRVSCGFPSTGKKSSRIGECWVRECSKDAHHEIFIHPQVDDPLKAAAILAHELIHAAVGLDQKHGGAFRAVALAVGLEGPMRATTPGDVFIHYVTPILEDVGAYPHGSLDTHRGISTKGPAQTGRLIKAECAVCGYIIRTTKKWAESAGPPICPCSHQPMVFETKPPKEG